MAENIVECTSVAKIDNGDVFNSVSSSARDGINIISNVVLPSWNLASSSTSVGILAAPTMERPALYEGQTTGDKIFSVGSILRTYLTTGEKTSTFSNSVALVNKNDSVNGALPDFDFDDDFDFGDINFSQCTNNLSVSAFDKLMASETNCEKEVPSAADEPSKKLPSEGALSEDEFETVGKSSGKGKVRFFKGRILSRSFRKRSSQQSPLRRCESNISFASSDGGLSEDEFVTPIGSKRARLSKGFFSKGRLIASPLKKHSLGKRVPRGCTSVFSQSSTTSSKSALSEDDSSVDCSQDFLVFSQQSERETLKKFKELKKTTAENSKRIETRINFLNNSLQTEETNMAIQSASVEQARQAVKEAQLNLQRALSALESEESEFNRIKNNIQDIRQASERCHKELTKSRQKYESLK